MAEVVKSYDAVAETRRIRDQLAREMKGMTPEEKVAYIEAQAAAFRHEQASPDAAQRR